MDEVERLKVKVEALKSHIQSLTEAKPGQCYFCGSTSSFSKINVCAECASKAVVEELICDLSKVVDEIECDVMVSVNSSGEESFYRLKLDKLKGWIETRRKR